MTSLAAFLYTSADCVLNYISQQQQRRGNHGDETDDVITLPGITLCNVNPLRSDIFDDVSKTEETIIPHRRGCSHVSARKSFNY